MILILKPQTMRRNILKGWLCASFFTVLGLSSCSEEQVPVVANNQLAVEAYLESTDGTKAIKESWSNDDKIGLFIKQSSQVTSNDYGEVTGQVVTYYNGTGWSLSPAVSLSATPAYVFGYYPYGSTVTNPSAVDIAVSAQTDILYSGPAKTASSNSPKVALSMKHAMSMLTFNIKKSGYIGAGNLTAVTMRNKSGQTKWASAGTLNIATGEISASANNPFTLNCNKSILADGWTSGLPTILAIPFSTGASSEVEVEFTVDGKSYVIDLPNSVAFNGGSKYILTLTITSGSMVMDNNNMQIVPWGADNPVDLGSVESK